MRLLMAKITHLGIVF